jgi:predicted transposase YdaD
MPELEEKIDLQKQDRKVVSMLETMPEKLLNEGKEEGQNEGRKESSRKIALKLLQKGSKISLWQRFLI